MARLSFCCSAAANARAPSSPMPLPYGRDVSARPSTAVALSHPQGDVGEAVVLLQCLCQCTRTARAEAIVLCCTSAPNPSLVSSRRPLTARSKVVTLLLCSSTAASARAPPSPMRLSCGSGVNVPPSHRSLPTHLELDSCEAAVLLQGLRQGPGAVVVYAAALDVNLSRRSCPSFRTCSRKCHSVVAAPAWAVLKW